MNKVDLAGIEMVGKLVKVCNCSSLNEYILQLKDRDSMYHNSPSIKYSNPYFSFRTQEGENI